MAIVKDMWRKTFGITKVMLKVFGHYEMAKTNGIVYAFGLCDFKSGWSSLGSNLITNNVNAVSLPCTHQAMSFSAFKMGGQCHPRLCLGWHCSPISKASNGIARCVLSRLTTFYQCTKRTFNLLYNC